MNTLFLFQFWVKVIAQKRYPDLSGAGQVNAAGIERMVESALSVSQEQLTAVINKTRQTPLQVAQEMEQHFVFNNESVPNPFAVV